MKRIIIPRRELYDPGTNRFISEEPTAIDIEPSLFALRLWESKWHIPFIGNKNLTEEQKMDYIRCICVTPDIPSSTFERLSTQNIKEINDYIEDPMTATTFSEKDEDSSREIVTAEIIYWVMVELGIPQEYQYWHINQLLTLIKVINIKRKEAENKSKRKGKGKPFTRADYEKRRALNEARKKQFNSHG